MQEIQPAPESKIQIMSSVFGLNFCLFLPTKLFHLQSNVQFNQLVQFGIFQFLGQASSSESLLFSDIKLFDANGTLPEDIKK